MATPSFELEKVLENEAIEILRARDNSFVLHHTTDIDAAGDEVEQKVREIIRRKLPTEYYVGHGHIVDEKLNYNGQHDIIITDNSGSPILFTSTNGTEYFPYESVYAIGEVKSTYYASKNYVAKYIEKIAKLYENLSRANSSPTKINKDVDLPQLTRDGETRPYINPIFKFMFFADIGDYNPSQIKDLLSSTNSKHIPNLICFLNKGMILQMDTKKENDNSIIQPYELFPEFVSIDKQQNYKWVFLELGKKETLLAPQLGYLLFALNHHLRNCIIGRPNIMKYFFNLFHVRNGHFVT